MKLKVLPFFITLLLGLNSLSLKAQIIEHDIVDWEYRMKNDSIWKPAKVPGTIIDNLFNPNDFSHSTHPYYGDNEKLYQWVGEKDWEFRKNVSINKTLLAQGYTYSLEFESLDLFCDIFINDQIFHHQNAFYPFRLENMTDTVLNIRILFHSTFNRTEAIMKNDSTKLPGGERVYARTPQYQFGWDWGPTFINMGIRKPVKIKYHPPSGIHCKQIIIQTVSLKKKKAILESTLEIKSNIIDTIIIHYTKGFIIPLIPELAEEKIIVQKGQNTIRLKTIINNPQLWWPNGSGYSSQVYQLHYSIQHDQKNIEWKNISYGLCEINLHKEKDKVGESFYFSVNGKKVFAKGANFIPDDSFNPGLNSTELVNMAADANMNMLRVWGGGIYPDNDFYEACLNKGIMVWQDFMFGCAMYPGDSTFLESVEKEAQYQVQRLSNYNNIAVWCGNNENDEGWKNWGWQKEFNYSKQDSTLVYQNYITLFENLLPNVVKNNDKNTAYIPTSPLFGWGRKESMTSGDSHYWGVWWGLEPIKKFEDKIPRFMSEFGMQAMPDMSTLKKVIADSAMNFNSSSFKNHQKHPTGFKTLDHYLKEYLVLPKNVDDYAYATQILQAYALTTAIEAQRRAMPYCMGSLLWQLNDCWPVTSWSLIDYSLLPKPALWEVKRAFEPLIFSVTEDSIYYHIYAINDHFYDIQETLVLSIVDFYGKPLLSKKIDCSIRLQSSGISYSIEKSSIIGMDHTKIFLRLQSDNNSFSPYYFHFTTLNKLLLPIPNFIVTPTAEPDKVDIVSNVYCPYAMYEGFYIGTLVPGEIHTIEIKDEYVLKSLLANPSNIKCLNTLLKSQH
jgi:beta-mannosidase